MTDTRIAFIGLGLIGGSIARGLKRFDHHITIMAYARSREKLEHARQEGTIDVILSGIGEELRSCHMVFLCTPVEYNAAYLDRLRPYLGPRTLVTDVGSTKSDIHSHVIRLGMEEVFVGGHPMAGSEKTGYEHSSDRLLENAYYIITPTARSRQEDVDRLVAVASAIGSIPIVLDYGSHDQITAAISHLPHIVASTLVNLVRDQDREDRLMNRLAAGGFKDITRIASSSPTMWEQICMTNRENLSQMLRLYLDSLGAVLARLEAGDANGIYELFETSKAYRDTLADKPKGSVEPEYSFTVDIADEVGSISTLSVILAAGGISIKNIGINHNRERGEGALKIDFYDREAMEKAWERLKKYHYELF